MKECVSTLKSLYEVVCGERLIYYQLYVNEEIFQGLLNPDRLRKRFKPDTHTIRNIIACVRYETRYSKFDQENVMERKKKWVADTNVKFFPKGSALKLEEIFDKFDSEYLEWDDVDDIEEIPLIVDIEVDNTLCFVYQSKHMQRLYWMNGKHLVLLDATRKVCKYSLPLFYFVLQTNVNFQIAAIIVIDGVTSELLTKALGTIKEWNPDGIPKYAMVDFDSGEILS